MQPPFHIAGNPDVDWIIFIAGLLVCLYWLRALRLAREGARLFLGNLTVATVVFILLKSFLTGRVQSNSATAMSWVAGLAVFGFRKQLTRRTRHIPKSVKRAVIKRDLEGEQYDPRKHHIDHRWPFSRGGSNTVDNLRVIAKEKNLKKGARLPRMREMW
jgi:5-methylcytosine-specific restriction endonuclease McrA